MNVEQVKQLRRDFFRDILFKIFKGKEVYNASYNGDGTYSKSEPEAYIEVCGDENEGLLLYYFNHWSNDIETVAAHFGIGYVNGELVDNLPPAPSEKHWWDAENSMWREPLSEGDFEDARN